MRSRRRLRNHARPGPRARHGLGAPACRTNKTSRSARRAMRAKSNSSMRAPGFCASATAPKAVTARTCSGFFITCKPCERATPRGLGAVPACKATDSCARHFRTGKRTARPLRLGLVEGNVGTLKRIFYAVAMVQTHGDACAVREFKTQVLERMRRQPLSHFQHKPGGRIIPIKLRPHEKPAIIFLSNFSLLRLFWLLPIRG